jgi:hypothetical protein
MDICHLHLHVREMTRAMREADVTIVKPLYEDDTFVSLR